MKRITLTLSLLVSTACGVEEIEAILAKYDTFGSTGSTGGADTSTSMDSTTGTETTAAESTTADTSSTNDTGTSMDTSSDSSGGTSDASSSTGQPPPTCGDGIVDPGETCDDMNDNPDDGCKLCTADRRVFASSVEYPGFTLDGLYGADQRCRMLAAIAKLPNFLTYRAWLSDSNTAAADRLVHSKGRYILVNGLVVAQDWDALISGTLENAINVTESSEVAGGLAWTGSFPNGQPAFGSSFCEAWDGGDDLQLGGSGVCSQTDAFWSFFEQYDCGSNLSLYCFEN